mgnify:CR=1 FL=1
MPVVQQDQQQPFGSRRPQEHWLRGPYIHIYSSSLERRRGGLHRCWMHAAQTCCNS